MSRVEVKRVPEKDDRSLPIFAEFDRLADRIRMQAYQLFRHRGEGEGRALDDWLAAEREMCWPAAELAETGDAFTLKVALAGFEPKDIEVTATPREVIVKAAQEQRKSGPGKEGELKWSEFRSSDVFRRFELPSDIEVDKLVASFNNGLLEVKAPKAAEKPAAEPARKIKLTTPP
jgi:HSP20 family protein